MLLKIPDKDHSQSYLSAELRNKCNCRSFVAIETQTSSGRIVHPTACLPQLVDQRPYTAEALALITVLLELAT
jgi:hypothetical protein